MCIIMQDIVFIALISSVIFFSDTDINVIIDDK